MAAVLSLRSALLKVPLKGTAIVLWLLTITGANAQKPDIETLLGSWSGTGTLVFHSGNWEEIRCNSYNTGGGDELRLVIRCASVSYRVEIRSRLSRQAGRLSGTWEERTYNAEGQANGQIGDGTLILAITGGGFSGSMKVEFSARSQTVNIDTEGIDMKSLRLELTKSSG